MNLLNKISELYSKNQNMVFKRYKKINIVLNVSSETKLLKFEEDSEKGTMYLTSVDLEDVGVVTTRNGVYVHDMDGELPADSFIEIPSLLANFIELIVSKYGDVSVKTLLTNKLNTLSYWATLKDNGSYNIVPQVFICDTDDKFDGFDNDIDKFLVEYYGIRCIPEDLVVNTTLLTIDDIWFSLELAQ